MSQSLPKKPVLLKAIELMLADPGEIRRETLKLKEKYLEKYRDSHTEEKINEMIIRKIISNYSYYSAFVGGATALTGVVPGLGTVMAAFGGATTDMALTMKYQVEMTMAIATICGHDIGLEEEKRLCFIVAGLGTINEAVKKGGKQVGNRAFNELIKKYVQTASAQAVKEVFKKVGITLSRKAAKKAIPFGVGVVIGFSANKVLTYYVGNRVRKFFISN